MSEITKEMKVLTKNCKKLILLDNGLSDPVKFVIHKLLDDSLHMFQLNLHFLDEIRQIKESLNDPEAHSMK